MFRCKKCKRQSLEIVKFKFVAWVDKEIQQREASCEVLFCKKCSKEVNEKFFVKIGEMVIA